MNPPQLKQIDVEKGNFEANGTTYYIQPKHITPHRFKHWQERAFSIMYGTSPKELFRSQHRIFKHATSGNDILDALDKIKTEAYNNMESIKQIEKFDEDNILVFCTLFINFEGEDLSRWDDAIVQRKLNDWKAEPFDRNVFFFLAMNQIPGLVQSFVNITENPDLETYLKNTPLDTI